MEIHWFCKILSHFSLASFCALSSVYQNCVHLGMAHDYFYLLQHFCLFLQPSLNFSLNPLTFCKVTILCVLYTGSSHTFTLLGCKLFLPTCLYQPTNLGWCKFIGPVKFWDTSHLPHHDFVLFINLDIKCISHTRANFPSVTVPVSFWVWLMIIYAGVNK